MPPDIFKMEMFENTQAFRLRVDGRKRSFSNTMMFRILLASPVRVLMYLHRFSVFVWRGENDTKALSKDVYIFCFLKTAKKSPFSNI